MKELLSDIMYVLRTAGQETGYERRVHLECAFDLMRQYQALVEGDLGIYVIKCGYCGRAECSH